MEKGAVIPEFAPGGIPIAKPSSTTKENDHINIIEIRDSMKESKKNKNDDK